MLRSLCVVLLLLLLVAAIAQAAGEAIHSPDPMAWVMEHWTQIVSAVAAFFIVYYIRSIDQKFDAVGAKFKTIFEWKDDVDRVMGVHSQVWGHGEGCGPLWIHHRSNGQSALHFRATDHPGLCERCKVLQGHVVEP